MTPAEHDALAIEIARDFTSDISTHNSLIEFARRYRAALKEKIEPVAWVDRDGCLLSEDQREEEPLPKSWSPLYSLEDWKP